MLNKVTLIGRLGVDPEVRYMPSGGQVTSFRMATDRRWKDKNNEKQTETEWHRITTFGKLAEICGQYLSKGSLIYIEGRIKTDAWEKEGTTQYSTGIIAENMTMLGGKGESQQQSKPAQNLAPPADDFEDDIPW
jgi:single-strand DNA-binding protein